MGAAAGAGTPATSPAPEVATQAQARDVFLEAETGSAAPSRDDQLASLLELRSNRTRPDAAAAPVRPLLARGSKGPAVLEMQQKLLAAGHSPGPLDGDFGPKTEAAVRSFQQARQLKVDGIAGPQTWGALDGVQQPPPVPQPPPGPPIPGPPIGSIPPRAPAAPSGSEFLASTRNLSRPQREAAILNEVLSGNVPEFLRNFKEIRISKMGSDGQRHEGIVRVLPDYLAIGSDQDFVRIPMSVATAQKLADAFGCSLPTTKLVNEVWNQADLRLAPRPMQPGPQMMSNDYFQRHQNTIEQQRAGRPLGELIAGIKKDVVLSNGYATHPGHVGIYGWHQLNGKPIQGLNFSHESSYSDYSHGARLVAGTMMVDGVERSIADVLRDPVLHVLLSDEGPIRNPRVPY